jgi:hypothetical protein
MSGKSFIIGRAEIMSAPSKSNYGYGLIIGIWRDKFDRFAVPIRIALLQIKITDNEFSLAIIVGKCAPIEDCGKLASARTVSRSSTV